MVLSLDLSAQFSKSRACMYGFFFPARLADTFNKTNKNLQIPIANFSLCHTTCTWSLQQAQGACGPNTNSLRCLRKISSNKIKKQSAHPCNITLEHWLLGLSLDYSLSEYNTV